MNSRPVLRRYLGWLKPRDIIVLVVAIPSVIALCQNRDQSRRIEALQMQTSAMSFRPRLTFLRAPVLEEYSVRPREIRELQSRHPTMMADITITYKVEVTNTGSAAARLVAQVFGDTLTGAAPLRGALKDPKHSSIPLKIVPSPEFYSFKEIQPSDTATFECEQPLTAAADSARVFHLLLLYENDAGQLYDSYYWAHFAQSPLWAVRSPGASSGDSVTTFTIKPEDMQRFLQLIDTNQSSEVYSPKEAEAIYKLISGAS